jgi:hypothetical protein
MVTLGKYQPEEASNKKEGQQTPPAAKETGKSGDPAPARSGGDGKRTGIVGRVLDFLDDIDREAGL